MFQELKFQLSTAILTIVTLAACVAGVINFEQQQRFRLPDDGVIWVDRAGGVVALHVRPSSGGANAGIHPGDRLARIDGVEIATAVNAAQVLARVGSLKDAKYLLYRNGRDFEPKVLVGEAPVDRVLLYQYLVGLAYLAIGLFVYFRRGSAYKARHFLSVLPGFVRPVLIPFHRQAERFRQTDLLRQRSRGPVRPRPVSTLLPHLSGAAALVQNPDWRSASVRSAGAALPGVSGFFFRRPDGIRFVRGIELGLDRVWMLLATLPYIVSGLVLAREYRTTEDPMVRQQLKWLRNGALCGALPFTCIYVLPYALGAIPNEYMKMSVFSLALIPLTLAYAIVRYRLMDVDILFRRGYAYTLATLCVLAAFYGLVFSLGTQAGKYFKDLGTPASSP